MLMVSGEKDCTRRFFRRNCLACKKPMYRRLLDGVLTVWCLTCKGVEGRKLIAVGDMIAICPKRAQAAVCICGRPKSEHQRAISTGEGSLVCPGQGKFTAYRPLRRKVKSIQKQTVWWAEELKTVPEAGPIEDLDELLLKEARREGGPKATWSWLKDALDGNIVESWRIEFEELKA